MGEYTTLRDNSRAVLNALDGLTKQVVDAVGFDIERRTKENIVLMEAVDTGNMLNSAAYDGNGNMRVTADYAAAVHDGHELANGNFVPGRPFLRKAVIEAVADLPDELDVTWNENEGER